MTRLLAILLLASLHISPTVDSFELVWSTLRDHYWDPTMAGLNWQELHDQYLAKVIAAANLEEARNVTNALIHKLPSSHLALIQSIRAFGGPASTGITVTPIDQKIVVEFSDNPDVHPGWIIESIDGAAASTSEVSQARLSGPVGSAAHIVFIKSDGTRATRDLPGRLPAGKLVKFGNLPPEHVIAEHRKLSSGAGYIRLNIFLDPVSVMSEFEQAIADLRTTPGIILDLRGNPGGLTIMAMGLAGWFVSDQGKVLGTMTSRSSQTQFEINPRPEPYSGKLAILVNGTSASTSEILAQGLKDLGRARTFGTRTAGEALPSEVIQLPDGDRFQ